MSTAPATVWTAFEEDGNGELYASEAIAKAGAIAIWAETCRENSESTTGPYGWHALKYSGQELLDGEDHTSVYVTEQPVHTVPVDYTAMRACGCPARFQNHSYGCKES